MTRSLRVAVLVWSCLCAAAVSAQGGSPPKGPADIMKRAAQARRKPALLPPASDTDTGKATRAAAPSGHGEPVESEQGALPPGHPPLPAADGAALPAADGAPLPAADTEGLPPGHPTRPGREDQEQQAQEEQPPVGNDPHAHAEGAPPLSRRQLSEGQPSREVPVGSIHVTVLDADEHPVPNADVQVGTMSQNSGRTSIPGKTGEDGTFTFSDLPTGDKQAYRVNVVYQGAKYSSMPFRLPVDRGYDVTIRRLETTQDARELVLYVGATSVELKDERLRIVQQARLVNIGSKTYVFPKDGTLLRFPKEAMAFQAEDVMTDQHLSEVPGEGAKITGSIPPGEVTLTWGFDLPQSGSEAELSFDLPWITFAYRVLADAAPGLTLQVDDMPAPELHEDRGRRLLVTEVVKRVGETPLRSVHIKLTGIPGPGPLRFIAVGLALGVLALGLVLSRKGAAAGGDGATALHDLQLEEERLLARAKQLEAEHARGEIGPEFHQNTLNELEEQLSGVLYERQRLAQRSRPARAVR